MIKLIIQVVLIIGLPLLFYNSEIYSACKSKKKDVQQLYFSKSSDDIGANFNETGIFDGLIYVTNSNGSIGIRTPEHLFNRRRKAILEMKASSNLPGIIIDSVKYKSEPGDNVYFSSNVDVFIPDSSTFKKKKLEITIDVMYANVELSKHTETTNFYTILSENTQHYIVKGNITTKEHLQGLLKQLDTVAETLRNTSSIVLALVILIILLVGLFVEEGYFVAFSFINFIIWNIAVFIYCIIFNYASFTGFFIQLTFTLLGFFILGLVQSVFYKLICLIFPDFGENPDNVLIEF